MKGNAPASRLVSGLRGLTLGSAGVMLAFTVPALFPGHVPDIVDLPCHFVPQYALGAVFLMALTLYLRAAEKWSIGLLAAALAVQAIILLPYVPLPQAAALSGRTLKILQANVLYLNVHPQPFEQLVKKERPDIILLSEANDAFRKSLAAMNGDYPYQNVLPDNDWADGLAVASKLPLEHLRILKIKGAEMPAQVFEVRFAGEKLNLYSLHTMNPLHGVAIRDAAFDGIAMELQRTKPSRVIILGDMNATPWCPALRKFTRDVPDLYNARDGRGLYASWPTFFPFLMRIPIDHTLVSKNIAVTSYRLGPDIGSDHFPVIATLALKDSP